MKLVAMIAILLLLFSPSESERIMTIEKAITSSNDIVSITDSLVIPYVYTKAISLNHLPVKLKKKKFFEMMLPAILVAKTELEFTYQKVVKLSAKAELTSAEKKYLDSLMVKYKAKTIHMLINRLHGFPVSIVLAQAALESGWGTSRFFLQANNPFGIWSFNTEDDRLVASSHRSGEKIYLRKYHNLEQAIEGYYVTLATGPYSDFRIARRKTSSPYLLCEDLSIYSEKGEVYVKELQQVIRSNDLIKYDSYQIAPKYIVD